MYNAGESAWAIGNCCEYTIHMETKSKSMIGTVNAFESKLATGLCTMENLA